MEKYENVISLGFFCNVTEDLMKLGKRSFSSPFDWTITSFEGILKLIDNNFIDFLNSKYLYQDKNNCGHYLNSLYNIEFYHDFDKKKSLNSQISNVEKKYQRRINRFYIEIEKPTLFIRYIQNKDELLFITKNVDYVKRVLFRNCFSNILYICNDDFKIDNFENIYFVKKDKDDSVTRKPIFSANLDKVINENVMFVDNVSIKKYKKILKKRKSILNKIKQKLFERMHKDYIHTSKQYIKLSEGNYKLYKGE